MTGPMGYDRQPAMEPSSGGLGVQVQRENLPLSDQRPFANHRGQGQGVQTQRQEIANGTGRLSAPFP